MRVTPRNLVIQPEPLVDEGPPTLLWLAMQVIDRWDLAGAMLADTDPNDGVVRRIMADSLTRPDGDA